VQPTVTRLERPIDILSRVVLAILFQPDSQMLFLHPFPLSIYIELPGQNIQIVCKLRIRGKVRSFLELIQDSQRAPCRTRSIPFSFLN